MGQIKIQIYSWEPKYCVTEGVVVLPGPTPAAVRRVGPRWRPVPPLASCRDRGLRDRGRRDRILDVCSRQCVGSLSPARANQDSTVEGDRKRFSDKGPTSLHVDCVRVLYCTMLELEITIGYKKGAVTFYFAQRERARDTCSVGLTTAGHPVLIF